MRRPVAILLGTVSALPLLAVSLLRGQGAAAGAAACARDEAAADLTPGPPSGPGTPPIRGRRTTATIRDGGSAR